MINPAESTISTSDMSPVGMAPAAVAAACAGLAASGAGALVTGTVERPAPCRTDLVATVVLPPATNTTSFDFFTAGADEGAMRGLQYKRPCNNRWVMVSSISGAHLHPHGVHRTYRRTDGIGGMPALAHSLCVLLFYYGPHGGLGGGVADGRKTAFVADIAELLRHGLARCNDDRTDLRGPRGVRTGCA